ncbi:MAG: hypothetical protein JSS38_09470 [Nitrospira sp.]|nr:hypothetical protein [Nitrospira sp.]
MREIAEGSSHSQVFHHYGPVRSGIGFTDSSNPFYLFSKLNVGLLLWAPFAPTMREEYPLLIARKRRIGGGVCQELQPPNRGLSWVARRPALLVSLH